MRPNGTIDLATLIRSMMREQRITAAASDRP